MTHPILPKTLTVLNEATYELRRIRYGETVNEEAYQRIINVQMMLAQARGHLEWVVAEADRRSLRMETYLHGPSSSPPLQQMTDETLVAEFRKWDAEIKGATGWGA